MGATWVKFKIRPGVEPSQVRELTAFVNDRDPRGYGLRPRNYPPDEAIFPIWEDALKRLQGLCLFHAGTLHDVDSPPDMPPLASSAPRSDSRQFHTAAELAGVPTWLVSVISCNLVFPIEWRDEAYRIVLPAELPGYYDKWRRYIQEVQSGHWRQYLHQLYLFDRLTEPHQYQNFEFLVGGARASLKLTNAWCRKERLAPIRDRILEFDPLARINALREATPLPQFDDAAPSAAVTAEQQQKESEYLALREAFGLHVRDWNRLVPQRWKVQYPFRMSFDEFLARADCTWLKNIFAWCEHLLDKGYGLFFR